MQDKHIFKEILGKEAWASHLSSLPTSNVYASWAWGEYKRRAGWEVQRISVVESATNTLTGCFQLQKKKLGFVTALFIQGGIHMKVLSDTICHEMFQSFLKAYVTSKLFTVVIVNQQSGTSQAVELGLLRNNFSPILNSKSYTYILDERNEALSGRTLSGNWRHNLKRAINNKQMSIKWVENPTDRLEAINRLEVMYTKLTIRKSFSGAICFNHAKDILAENDEFKIVEAWIGEEVVATRVCFFCNDHVLDFIAASTETATKTYANYLLLWEMIRMAQSKGLSYFDCGGIDPAGNMGVYNFKKGLGGRLAVNGPMWLNASNDTLKKIGRVLLSVKL